MLAEDVTDDDMCLGDFGYIFRARRKNGIAIVYPLITRNETDETLGIISRYETSLPAESH